MKTPHKPNWKQISVKSRDVGTVASIQQWIEYCIEAAEAAWAATPKSKATGNGEAALAAAGAWKVTMPAITNHHSIAAYIACVAAGMSRGYITAKEASTMLYVAQCAISAHGSKKKAGAK